MSPPSRRAVIGAMRWNRRSAYASSSGPRRAGIYAVRSRGTAAAGTGVRLYRNAETRALAARKLALIEQKIADLAAMRQLLGGSVQQCDAIDDDAACPIIEVLARE